MGSLVDALHLKTFTRGVDSSCDLPSRMADPRTQAPTPYLLGPSAVPVGGFEWTVLIRTYTMPWGDALLYAEHAAGREATPLLLRQPNQAMPNEREFYRLLDAGGLLITVEFDEGAWTDEELWTQVQKSIDDCLEPEDACPPPELDDDPVTAPDMNVPDLTPEERRAFLKAFYGSSPHPDGG